MAVPPPAPGSANGPDRTGGMQKWQSPFKGMNKEQLKTHYNNSIFDSSKNVSGLSQEQLAENWANSIYESLNPQQSASDPAFDSKWAKLLKDYGLA